MNEQGKERERQDGDILFSRAVKAGKRIYYFDVKHDRHGEYYISITESKRVREGDEATRPVFEKHKIFLYREDLERFSEAFGAAADYTRQNGPVRSYHRDYYSEGQECQAESEHSEAESGHGESDLDNSPLKIEF